MSNIFCNRVVVNIWNSGSLSYSLMCLCSLWSSYDRLVGFKWSKDLQIVDVFLSDTAVHLSPLSQFRHSVMRCLLLLIAYVERNDLGLWILDFPLQSLRSAFSYPRMCHTVRSISVLHTFNARNYQDTRLGEVSRVHPFIFLAWLT